MKSKLMQTVIQFLFLFCAVCLFSWVGRSMHRNPESIGRFLSFGKSSTKFRMAFIRVVGRIFQIFFALGAVMYLTLLVLALLGVKIPA